MPHRSEARLLAAKIALERELVPPLRTVLRHYLALRMAGSADAADRAVRQHLANLLLEHYARVAMVVTGRHPVRRSGSIGPATVAKAALTLRHARSMYLRAGRSAGLIIASLERQVATFEAMTQAGTKAASAADLEAKADDFPDDVPPEEADRLWRAFEGGLPRVAIEIETGTGQPRPAAPEVPADLARRLESRLPAIANAETNGPAEEARQEIVVVESGGSQVYKAWSTMLDSKVRPSHSAAEDERTTVDRPFVVGGEMMMFPGDASLGASIGNRINCRCSARYFTLDSAGNRVDIAATPRLTPLSPVQMGGGRGRPLEVTSAITLNPGTRGKVVLADGQTANVTYRASEGTIVVTRDGQRLGSAEITTTADGRLHVGSVSIAADAQSLDIEGLVRRSVDTTNRRFAPAY